MKKLVLIRHGESLWNKENRFTGWTDVDLSPQGVEEARAAGRLLAAEGFDFDVAFTSVLRRAIRTLHFALEEMDRLWLPVEKHWRLNERHYGSLQGIALSVLAFSGIAQLVVAQLVAAGSPVLVTLSFLALLVPAIRSRADLAAATVAGAVVLLAAGLPYRLALVVASLAGIAAGVVAEWRHRK